MTPPLVEHISEWFIKPKFITKEMNQPVYLTPWDLMMLSVNYIQKGLLFAKPKDFNENSLNNLLKNLKETLSLTLVHFYPLSGRFSTLKQESPNLYTVFIDCENSPGARFIQASLNVKIADILSPSDVPLIVRSLFDHDRAVNHDGHEMSLLSIKVTELVDGIFFGCSMNHAIADGTSFWHFFNSWSEIFREKGRGEIVISLSSPPVHNRWFPLGLGPILNLPFTHQDQFIIRWEAPILRERFFHFSAESLAKIKAKANKECNTNKISTLQALSAHLWRCVTRARGFEPHQETNCRLAISNRTRMNPPLANEYFGNCFQAVKATATSGEVLENSLGYAAWRLHQAVTNHNDEKVREWVDYWMDGQFVFNFGRFFDPASVMMGSSPRFDMYGNEFGFGKALAIRSGYANKFDGKISFYPGAEGGSSVDLEVCLMPHFMTALESDFEFVETVSI